MTNASGPDAGKAHREWTRPRWVIEDTSKYMPEVEMWTVVLKQDYDALASELAAAKLKIKELEEKLRATAD